MDKIIDLFLENPDKEYYIRQLSRIFKKSPTTISKMLDNYKKEGILKAEKKLNHILFKADFENKNFKLMKLYYNLKLINKSGLISYLEKEFNHPQAIVLFGSFAKSEDIASSDIDLLIIFPLKKEINLEEYEKKLGHKIQLFIKSIKDIEEMKKTNKELLNSFINGITLYGLFEVFK